MEKSKHYSGISGENYDLQFDDFEIGFKVQSSYFNDYIREDDVVLDFGCGRGFILANIPCKEKHGVEINEHSRVYAKENLDKVYKDLEQAPDEFYNKVISNHALEHTPVPYLYLTEIFKKLKKQGMLIMVLPLDDWRDKNQRNFNPNDIDQHLYTWTPQSIGNLVKSANFSNIKIEIINKAWSPKIFFLLKYRPIFNFAQTLLAVLKKKRQLLITAIKL